MEAQSQSSESLMEWNYLWWNAPPPPSVLSWISTLGLGRAGEQLKDHQGRSFRSLEDSGWWGQSRAGWGGWGWVDLYCNQSPRCLLLLLPMSHATGILCYR